MKTKTNEIAFFPLQSHPSVQDFLLLNFQCSKARLKKYFDKKFLERSLIEKKPIQLPLNFVNDGEINPNYDGPPIKIIFEDEIFLVLNKPEKIFVHPLTYDESNNCLSFMRTINNNYLKVNEKSYDRGLLYRLDFETSGVLVYLKKDEIYFNLRKNFDQMVHEKLYFAKVAGEFKKIGLIEQYLVSSESSGSKMKVYAEQRAQSFHAKLEVLESCFDVDSNTSLLKIKLLTGHRHQIRAQLSGLGFPIIGDSLYGGLAFNRLCLHAFSYSMELDGKAFKFESPHSF